VVLNFVFLAHAAVACVSATAMLFFPKWFTEAATGVNLGSDPVSVLAIAYLRLAAIGAIAIVAGSTLARQSASTRARWAGLIAMLVLLAATLAIALFVPFAPLRLTAIAISAAFVAAYLYVLLFARDEV
jgi:membrane-associated HD superfamily phosphohydrolase